MLKYMLVSKRSRAKTIFSLDSVPFILAVSGKRDFCPTPLISSVSDPLWPFSVPLNTFFCIPVYS